MTKGVEDGMGAKQVKLINTSTSNTREGKVDAKVNFDAPRAVPVEERWVQRISDDVDRQFATLPQWKRKLLLAQWSDSPVPVEERTKVLMEALKAVENERLELHDRLIAGYKEADEQRGDEIYSLAIRDAEEAIKQLLAPAPVATGE